MAEQAFTVRNDQEMLALFGRHDQHLRRVEQALGVSVVLRGEEIKVSGPEPAVASAIRLFEDLIVVVRSGAPLRKDDVDYALRALQDTRLIQLRQVYQERIEVPSKRRFVIPRTPGQKAYVDAMRTHDIVFGIGPAGTGKTYLGMAMAVENLTKGEVSRIILTRPAVEAGERLGYLPGDLSEKINPYLRPLYDALYEMMEIDMVQRYLDRGIIEVAPLAYMRGRTLNDSFIILDEAQNTTSEQMKMFLTRLGFDSKAV
ncbi:MAG: PhoH family protein, partial [Candidatus Omnitrophica bacterium]|nr:PhoH family protein [Candidatus Omnitrophota bacterium]